MKKRICLIAQFPPPIHGLSKAVDTLYRSDEMNRDYDLIKVDITNNKRFLSNYRAIAKTEADLFYFTISQSIGGNLRDLMILRLLNKQGKKCLIHLHGGYFRKLFDNDMRISQRKQNEKALKNICGAIVLGNSLKYIFDGLVDDSKIFVVPNCVDDDYLLSDAEIRTKINKTNECFHVLFLSNLIRSKGYDVVLKMAKEYKNNPRNKNIHFDFAGNFFEDNERNYFEKYVKENKLESIITYHGVVSGDKKRILLKNSTFFILPTNYPREGQPISILEAMGNGLVVLTTNHAGIPDVVKNVENGCMIPYSEELSHKYLEYILTLSDDVVFQIQERNYKKIKSNFLENTYIDNLKKCFQSQISN